MIVLLLRMNRIIADQGHEPPAFSIRYRCPHHDTFFVSMEEVRSHLKAHHLGWAAWDRPYECSKCTRSFRALKGDSQNALEYHLKANHDVSDTQISDALKTCNIAGGIIVRTPGPEGSGDNQSESESKSKR